VIGVPKVLKPSGDTVHVFHVRDLVGRQLDIWTPEPVTSTRVAVSPAFKRMNGRTFQPWPRRSAARALAVGLGSDGLGMAMAPLPFSPVGFMCFSSDLWQFDADAEESATDDNRLGIGDF
jgi:hypothetical protein